MAKGGQRAGFPQGPSPGLLFTGRSWALFLQGARSSHPPNGPPYSKRKSGEDQSRRRLAQEPGVSQGERGGSQSPGMGPWGAKGSCSPLGPSEQEA